MADQSDFMAKTWFFMANAMAEISVSYGFPKKHRQTLRIFMAEQVFMEEIQTRGGGNRAELGAFCERNRGNGFAILSRT